MKTVTKINSIKSILPTRKRVVAYARVSTNKEAQLDSLHTQISHYSKFIQANPLWEYGGIYYDEGITGTKGNRPQFQKMLEDCRKCKIDLIITKAISRFARNTVDTLTVVRELKAIGVEVYFEKENIYSSSKDGELMLSVLSAFAQEESLNVSENCKWRIRKNYKEGIPNTFEIYGYDVSKGELKINPAEAEIVRQIFNDYISGLGGLAIAKKLMSLGIKTRLGRDWNSAKIRDILKNEKYIGDLLLQKVFISDHLQKKKVKNNGNLQKYYVQDNHEAIIDRETFNRVQQILFNRRKTLASSTTYAFTSKIECGICGKFYQRKLNNAGTKYQKAVWICSTYNTLGKNYCSSKQIPEGILEDLTNQFNKGISKITAYPNNMLKFIFSDNTVVEKEWHY